MSDLSQRLQDVLVGRYRIEHLLGRGGMATVFLAEDLKHHRRVAVKVLDPEVAAALGPERFLREIETVAQLTHPHILVLHDSGEANGLLYYVMPFVEGGSLRDRLTRERQLALEDALRIAREVADALSHAHGHGIVHRDIKPENILLEGGHAVVADFGIARAATATGGTKLTSSGVALGTPGYTSPEQAVGGVVDSRSDIYGLGCVLYEMLAGQAPFTGPTAESIVFQHLNAPPPRVTVMRPAVPAGLDLAITKAMAKAPADRFATMAGFSAALSSAVTADAPPPQPIARRIPAWVPAAVVGVITTLIVLAAWQHWRPFGSGNTPQFAQRDSMMVEKLDGPPADSVPAMAQDVDELVGQLFASAAAGPRDRRSYGVIRFEGVAWETGEGVSAGTSNLGLKLDRDVISALTGRGMTIVAGSFADSRGIGSTILRGGFQVLRPGVQLSLALVNASSGQVISKAQRLLMPANFMSLAQAEMLPPDAANAKRLARLIVESFGGAPAASGLRVSTDRGPHAAYTEGETLHVLVESDRDCYVRLYHISWSDRALTLAFPNRGDKNSYLPAGTLKSIPADGTGVVFEVSKPYGVDALIAISSAEPFEDQALVAAGLGGAAAGPWNDAAKGVTRVGDYLARQGINEAQAKGVLAKGLLVRLPSGSASSATGSVPAALPEQTASMPAPGPTTPTVVRSAAPPNVSPDQRPLAGTSPVPPQTASPPAPSSLAGRPSLAKAVCFYTTLPRSRQVR